MCEEVASRAGTLSEQTRRLMVAAIGTCTHHYTFPDNMTGFLRMVGKGRARPFRWHGHVDPKRWIDINTLVVGIQGWLQDKSIVTLSREFPVRQKDLGDVMKLIGNNRSPLKRAMLQRQLWSIIRGICNSTRLGIIGDPAEVPKREIIYVDFREAYRLDGGRYFFEFKREEMPIRRLEEKIEATGGKSGAAFLAHAKLPLVPFCTQALVRMQRVTLYRIGRQWTDPFASPPGGVPRPRYQELQEDFAEAINRWYEEQDPAANGRNPEVGSEVARLLGKPDAAKRAVVDCLTFRSKLAQDLQEATFYWLEKQGLCAAQV